MDILVLDFETFYDKDFSLSKITTEEYIRSPKFEVVGVAVKRNDEPTVWFSGDFKATKKWLQQWDIPNNAVCAQNAHFDVAILNWVYGLRPARIIDTLSMANVLHGVSESCSLSNLAKLYGIGEKGTEVIKAQGKRREDFSPSELAEYGAYCKNDVDLTHELMHRMVPQFPKKELKLIDLTVRMFTEPKLRLDKNILSEALHQLGVERRTLILNLMRELGVKNEETLKKQLMSNEQFAQLLRENGVEPPTKISPTTGKVTYAFAKTDEEFSILEDHPNPTIQAMYAARMGFKSTIAITRTEAFLGIAERGTFPFPLKYSGASVTHRWSGCLVADTKIIVYDYLHGVREKSIIEVLPDDLVWDGEEFVKHDGVKFSGYREVIEHCGVVGTPEHVVFTECGKEVSLLDAKNAGYNIKVADYPNERAITVAKIK